MAWLDRFTWPLTALSDLQRDVLAVRMAVLQIPARITRMEKYMAADRELLANIAEGLTALATPVSDLIASEAALRAEVAELKGAAAADEAGDLEAASLVKEAFDDVAEMFRTEPEAPDVEPLPEPEVPAEPAPAEPVEDDSTPPPAA